METMTTGRDENLEGLTQYEIEAAGPSGSELFEKVFAKDKHQAARCVYDILSRTDRLDWDVVSVEKAL